MHDGRNRRSATTSIDEQGFRRRPLRRDSESVGLYYIPAFAETPLAGAHTIVEIRGDRPPYRFARKILVRHTRDLAQGVMRQREPMRSRSVLLTYADRFPEPRGV